jgi:hypothetical protein
MANVKLSQIAPGGVVNFNTDFLIAVQQGNTTDARITPAQLWTSFAGQPFAGAIVAPVRTSSGPTVVVSPTADYFLALDTASNAITVLLPFLSQVPVGISYLIKDATGHAGLHAITVQPSSGTIDNSSNFVMNTSLQSIAVTNIGTQWSIN